MPKTKKLTRGQQYTREYLRRLAWIIVQFWPLGEEIPEGCRAEAMEDEVFLTVSIRRLQLEERVQLLAICRRMAAKSSGVFSDWFRGTPECRELVENALKRFSQLIEAGK